MRYKGGLIRATELEPTQLAASGVWILPEALQARAAGNWPLGNLTVITPTAVNTSFTFASGGAAEAQMYDGNDATPFADPAGANGNTHAAYQFSVAREIRRLRFITHSANGFTAAMTVNIAHSDTSLTTGFTNVDTMVIPAGLSQIVLKDIAAFGSHVYWRFHYASGTTGGNAWGGEFSMYAFL